VWVVGTTLHHYDGHAWSTIAMPSDAIYSLGHHVAVGQHGTVYRTNATLDVIAGSDARIDLTHESYGESWSDAAGDVWVTDGSSLFAFMGASWADVTPPTFARNDTLQAIGGTGPDDVWTFAFAGTAFHYEGATWTSQPEPATDALVNSVSATTPDNVWAVGSTGQAGVVVHFDGSAWTTVAVPLPQYGGSVDNNGVFAIATNDVWMTGYLEEDPGGMPLLYHYDGTAWTDVSP
jgi:hypothetical protein